MARIAELLRQGASVPTELQAQNLWAKIEVHTVDERPRPRFARERRFNDYSCAFNEAKEARPGRKRVSARVTKCSPTSYVGTVRRGYDAIVCKKSAWEG